MTWQLGVNSPSCGDVGTTSGPLSCHRLLPLAVAGAPGCGQLASGREPETREDDPKPAASPLHPGQVHELMALPRRLSSWKNAPLHRIIGISRTPAGDPAHPRTCSPEAAEIRWMMLNEVRASRRSEMQIRRPREVDVRPGRREEGRAPAYVCGKKNVKAEKESRPPGPGGHQEDT